MNRAEFFDKLEPYHAPSTLLDIQLAYTLAKYGHRAQVRKEIDENGNPLRYFEHVRRVATVLIDEAKIVDRDMVISSLLHDGIEDTTDMTPAMIEHVFGADVVRLVKTLSKVPKNGYLGRFYRCNDWRPYVIKACDRLDNLRSLNQTDPEFQLKIMKETKDLYLPLFRHMTQITPTEHKASAFALNAEIVSTVENWFK